jgi:hypothetical protein
MSCRSGSENVALLERDGSKCSAEREVPIAGSGMRSCRLMPRIGTRSMTRVNHKIIKITSLSRVCETGV